MTLVLLITLVRVPPPPVSTAVHPPTYSDHFRPAPPSSLGSPEPLGRKLHVQHPCSLDKGSTTPPFCPSLLLFSHPNSVLSLWALSVQEDPWHFYLLVSSSFSFPPGIDPPQSVFSSILDSDASSTVTLTFNSTCKLTTSMPDALSSCPRALCPVATLPLGTPSALRSGWSAQHSYITLILPL